MAKYWVRDQTGGSVLKDLALNLLATTALAGLVQLGVEVRERLSAARTYYVRTDGNDANNGLVNSAGGAFLTVQHAIDVAASIDSVIYDVTIQCAAGTYSNGLGLTAKSMVGAGAIIIVGDETTPSNVVFDTNTANGAGLNSVHVTTVYKLRGMKFTATGGGASFGIQTSTGSYVEIKNVDFGAMLHHMRALDGSQISAVSGNYTISGNATLHWFATAGSTIRVQTNTVTLTGTPAFATAFALANRAGAILAASITFSGAATGSRYSAASNGVIDTSGAGATYLPGDAAGSTATGGQYV